MEGIRRFGPNVIHFNVINGNKRQPVVGCYIPPSNAAHTTLQSVINALNTVPTDLDPWVLGDLNINYDSP